jgi:hypothetical protein
MLLAPLSVSGCILVNINIFSDGIFRTINPPMLLISPLSLEGFFYL